jgi:hypothetical protein
MSLVGVSSPVRRLPFIVHGETFQVCISSCNNIGLKMAYAMAQSVDKMVFVGESW